MTEKVKRTAVVVRSAVHFKVDLVVAYLENLPRDEFDFWVLFDVTNAAPDFDQAKLQHDFQSLVNEIPTSPRAWLYFLNDTMVMEEFPTTPFGSAHTSGGPGRGKSASLGWDLADVFVATWRAGTELGDRYPWVWVNEDDVRLAGDDYSTFFRRYGPHRDEDLIAFDFFAIKHSGRRITYTNHLDGVHLRHEDLQQHEWGHANQINWKADKMTFTEDWVRRFSRKLLDTEYSFLRQNLIAQNEMFISTLCAGDPGHCTFSAISESEHGSRLSWNIHIPEEDWPGYERDETGKWFHALKWLGKCNATRVIAERLNADLDYIITANLCNPHP
jgi:hypothetical protein